MSRKTKLSGFTEHARKARVRLWGVLQAAAMQGDAAATEEDVIALADALLVHDHADVLQGVLLRALARAEAPAPGAAPPTKDELLAAQKARQFVHSFGAQLQHAAQAEIDAFSAELRHGLPVRKYQRARTLFHKLLSPKLVFLNPIDSVAGAIAAEEKAYNLAAVKARLRETTSGLDGSKGVGQSALDWLQMRLDLSRVLYEEMEGTTLLDAHSAPVWLERAAARARCGD
jgi:hypothetical protein